MLFQMLFLLKTLKMTSSTMALPIRTTLMIMILGMMAVRLRVQGHLMSLDPLECLIQELEDIASMDRPDISAVNGDMPVSQAGDVSGMSVEEAVQV